MASLLANLTVSPTTAASAFPTTRYRPIHTLFHYKPSTINLKAHSSRFTTAVCCLSTLLHRPEYIPNRISDANYVRIFDTTLRDGEQSPGATMTIEEKLKIARVQAKLGVDIIEAGFPASSEADFEAVKLIAQEVGNAVMEDGYVPVICGLSRCNKNDISKAWEAVKYAKRPRIHTFIATSEIHMEYKLKMTREQVLEKARSMVSYARSLGCDDVEFSPEDAGRYHFCLGIGPIELFRDYIFYCFSIYCYITV